MNRLAITAAAVGLAALTACGTTITTATPTPSSTCPSSIAGVSVHCAARQSGTPPVDWRTGVVTVDPSMHLSPAVVTALATVVSPLVHGPHADTAHLALPTTLSGSPTAPINRRAEAYDADTQLTLARAAAGKTSAIPAAEVENLRAAEAPSAPLLALGCTADREVVTSSAPVLHVTPTPLSIVALPTGSRVTLRHAPTDTWTTRTAITTAAGTLSVNTGEC